MDEPLISIVTAVYNGQKYIENNILSIINQKYKNIEHIIIDGGSNDSTLSIINKYSDKIKYVISEPDDGIYDAINKGLKQCAIGSYVIIVGCDDVLDNLSDAVHIIKNNLHSDTFICDVTQLNNLTGKKKFYQCFVPETDVENYFLQFPFHHQGFITKALADDCYDTKIGLHADLYFMLDKVRDLKPVKINVSLCIYRTGGASDDFSWGNIKSFYKVANKLNINFIKICIKRPFVFSIMVIKCIMPNFFRLFIRSIKESLFNVRL